MFLRLMETEVECSNHGRMSRYTGEILVESTESAQAASEPLLGEAWKRADVEEVDSGY